MIFTIISFKGILTTERTEFLYNNFLWVLCGEIPVVQYFLLFFIKLLNITPSPLFCSFIQRPIIFSINSSNGLMETADICWIVLTGGRGVNKYMDIPLKIHCIFS